MPGETINPGHFQKIRIGTYFLGASMLIVLVTLEVHQHYKHIAMLSKKSCFPSGYFSFTAMLISIFFASSGIAQTIDLTRPVGMTPGEAGSNGMGGAMYSIPIELPQGVKGMQPSVSLTYSSMGGGDGFSGNGWTLSPCP